MQHEVEGSSLTLSLAAGFEATDNCIGPITQYNYTVELHSTSTASNYLLEARGSPAVLVTSWYLVSHIQRGF